MEHRENLRLIEDQFSEGQDFLQGRKQRQVQQLGLLNNLQRGDQNIAATTLFAQFNRVHSGLYSDTITVRFIPTEDSDFKKTELLNKMQLNDYKEMEKWKLDYDWLWNACFYGDGFVNTLNWDKERKIMVPESMNPLMMVYDPYFSEPNEWRYYGQWISKSGNELKRLQRLGIINPDVDIDKMRGGFDPQVWAYKSQHDMARLGTGVPDESVYRHNQVYQLVEFYTYDEDGNKCLYWTDKDFTQLLRKKVLDLGDDDRWPVVRKQIFREPNSSISISVPDLLEDKHRAESVMLNLIYLAAKDEANPIYAYNPDIVKDVTQFLQRQLEQHIPMEDIEKGVKRLNLGPSLSNSVLQFISLLRQAGSDAIGSTIVQPTMPRGKKSATESALAQQIADLASNLQSKIVGMGEKEFWSHWYQRHLHHMKDANKKTITITNVTSVSFESIGLEDIKTKFPPKIEILSQRDADYKELVKRRDWMQVYPVIEKSLPPKALSALNKHVFFPLFIKDSSTIDRMVPKSIGEIKAEQENEILESDAYTPIDGADDDEEHMYIHMMAKKTAAVWAHYFAHQAQYSQKQMQQQQQQQKGEEGNKNQVKNYTENNAEGAVPLAQETGDETAKGRLNL